MGELTSVAAIPVAGGVVRVGLGYARREAAGPGARLEFAGNDGPGWAVPLVLPVGLRSLSTPAGDREELERKGEGVRVV